MKGLRLGHLRPRLALMVLMVLMALMALMALMVLMVRMVLMVLMVRMALKVLFHWLGQMGQGQCRLLIQCMKH
jgi:hypothetical protein